MQDDPRGYYGPRKVLLLIDILRSGLVMPGTPVPSHAWCAGPK